MYAYRQAPPANHPPSDPPAGWEELLPGTRIEIRVEGRHIGYGTVDAVMPDGSVLWFWLDGGLGRQLVHISDHARLQSVA